MYDRSITETVSRIKLQSQYTIHLEIKINFLKYYTTCSEIKIYFFKVLQLIQLLINN